MKFFPEVIRREIIETLETIGSRESQIEYQNNVPIIHVPSELICQWFDDHYLPDSSSFISSFNQKELDAMKSFNDYFYELLSEIKSDPAFNNFPQIIDTDLWKKIMTKANETLKVFNLK